MIYWPYTIGKNYHIHFGKADIQISSNSSDLHKFYHSDEGNFWFMLFKMFHICSPPSETHGSMLDVISLPRNRLYINCAFFVLFSFYISPHGSELDLGIGIYLCAPLGLQISSNLTKSKRRIVKHLGISYDGQ